MVQTLKELATRWKLTTRISQQNFTMRIQWIFNTPTTAGWRSGGWWKFIMQMIKKLLGWVLGKACLKYEEIYTVFCYTEAVINYLPLTYFSEDAQDLMPLEASMFLQENKTVKISDNLDSINLAKIYRYQERLSEELRIRYNEEYLSLFIQQNFNENNTKQLSVGEVILVGCDKSKRMY